MISSRNYGEASLNLATAHDDIAFLAVCADEHLAQFVLCDVYFDAIFKAALPQGGVWTEPLLSYHCNLNWLNAPWMCTDLAGLIRVFAAIPRARIVASPFGEGAARIRTDLLCFLQEAKDAGCVVVLEER